MKVIASYGYGNLTCYAANVANAKKILSWQPLPEAAKQFNPNEKYRTKEKTIQLLEKILASESGTKLSESLTVTKEMQDELLTELRAQGVSVTFDHAKVKIEDYEFWKKSLTLPSLHQIFSVPHFDAYIIDWGSRWYRIKNDSWKATATEDSKIRAILLLVNELAGDEIYQLVELNDQVE